jgi:hypothetical protein
METKEMNTRETTKLDDLIFDLPVAEAQQDQVKGGPIWMQYEGVEGTVRTSGYERQIQ